MNTIMSIVFKGRLWFTKYESFYYKPTVSSDVIDGGKTV